MSTYILKTDKRISSRFAFASIISQALNEAINKNFTLQQFIGEN